MNSFFHILAIIHKQVRDSLKNRLILMIFFMFPALAIVFNFIVDKATLKSLIPSFLTINTIMVPIIFMSSIVAEEKETHSLQMLIMSNIKSWEYLLGVGICVFVQSIVSSCLFLFVFDISVSQLPVFITALTIGITYSLIIGAILAIIAKNQMSVGPVAAPASMLLGLLPMFSEMNGDLNKFAGIFYSYYVRKMFFSLEFCIDLKSIIVLLLNFVFLILIFTVLYRIKRFSNE